MMNGGKFTKDLIMNKVGNFFKMPDIGNLENGNCNNNTGGNRNGIDLANQKFYFNGMSTLNYLN